MVKTEVGAKRWSLLLVVEALLTTLQRSSGMAMVGRRPSLRESGLCVVRVGL